MNKAFKRPSTIDGLKRCATHEQRKSGLPRHKALDSIAQAAGYANYKHARKYLHGSPPPTMRGFRVGKARVVTVTHADQVPLMELVIRALSLPWNSISGRTHVERLCHSSSCGEPKGGAK